MEQEPGSGGQRGQEIDDRLVTVRARIEELRRRQQRETRPATAGERLAAAQAHANASQATAARVLASAAKAFRRAAEAHERAASVHERSAASGVGDVAQHQELTAFHRAAAEDDRERAKRADSLVSGVDVSTAVRELPQPLAEPRPGEGQRGTPTAREQAHAARLAFLSQVRKRTAQLGKVHELRRQLESELERAEQIQTLGQLTSGIAHDFGNLLAVIVGYAEMAEDISVDLDPELRRIIREIHIAADRAVRLSDDLLRFSRRARTKPETIDLNTLIAGMRYLLGVSMAGRAEVIFKPSSGPLATVRADRHQLEQVMLNLAVNAGDAMPDGGALTISTGIADFDEHSSAMHTGTRPGRYVELTVRDTGTGMSADIKDKIFERFFTTKPAGTGTGLGLSTVHGIVSDLGGTIEVESEVGRGTAFRIFLPASPA